MEGSALENPTQVDAYVHEAYVAQIWNNEDPEKSQAKEVESMKGPKILTEEEKKLKRSILKNILCLSFAFALLFTSFYSLTNLQSSLHKKMGTTSLGFIYVALVTSCFFLPSLIIKALKPKWGIFLAMVLYSPYFAALYYPRYYTFVPSAFLLGLSAAPLWAAKCTYITKIGEKYGEIVGEDFDVVVVRFFGIFFFFLQSSQVWGNLISSAVLSVGVSNYTRSDEFLETCGANFCPDSELDSEAEHSESIYVEGNDTSESSHESPVDPFKIYLMTTIYLLLIIFAAAFLALFVDPLTKYNISASNPKAKTKELLFATMTHMKKPYQILLIPLTLWSGVEQGFLSADYTASFVTCGIGIHMVGYAYLCFGVTDAIFSLAFAPLIKYVKRVPIFTFAAIINVILIIVMFTWKPHPDDYAVFFVIPCLWGMADAVWQTQINAFYGVIFPGESEAAFSNYRLWEAFGFIVAYIISTYLCMSAKLYINLAFLAVGMVGYYIIEAEERIKSKKNLR